MMGLDLWFRQDVERILKSAASAASRYSDDRYREGYQAALGDVALAFGLPFPLEALEGTLRRRSQEIDDVMTDLGLNGKVTSGQITGDRERPTHVYYVWKGGKHVDPVTLTGALLDGLGPGVTWKGERDGLVVRVPL